MSPIIYSITEAQANALKAFPQIDQWRLRDALVKKGLITSPYPKEAKLTPLGQALRTHLLKF